MAILVQKFGGTSVANTERIRNVATLVEQAVASGNKIAVVVSAMAGTTDQLAAWCAELGASTSSMSPMEADTVLASGEQIVAGLLAITLHAQGIPARSYMGWQLPIHTDGNHRRAAILDIDTRSILSGFERGEVAIVSGFQGIAPHQRISTLGRGGSDLSAVALAVALSADACDIYTDVPGIYSCDPRRVPRAQLLPCITYEEMLEMAAAGAKVLHTRAVQLAMRERVKLRVLSSFTDHPGTWVFGMIQKGETMEKYAVTGLAYSLGETGFGLNGLKPQALIEIIDLLARQTIHIDMLVQGGTSLSLTVPTAEAVQTQTLLEEYAARTDASFTALPPIAKISAVGIGMPGHTEIARRMLQTLAAEAIPVLVMTTSEIRVSVLISAQHVDQALKALHSTFGLDQAYNQEDSGNE